MARLAIRMPKMSMTMTEGEVSSWMVDVGAEVAEGDVVCEVMTDKVDMEVESTVTGTLVEIVVPSGTVEVGEPIGWVEGEDTGGGFGDLLSAPEPEPQPEPRPEPSVTTVEGVPAAEAPVTVLPAEPEAPAPPKTPAARPAAPAAARKAAIRAAVARKMTPSAAIPQFTVWREIELDAANAGRRGVSWTTVLLRAYAAALRDVPDLLCRWEDDRATESGPPSIALAVATDRGLLVPTFAEPDLGDARAVDAEIRAVVKSAHTGRLDPSYMGVANGSLSNLGGLNVDRFQALLTPPQASVLSLGAIRQRPVAVPGGVGLALTVHAGLTVDHRVADGAHAAELLERFARLLGGAL